jgi:hypothetical protein
LAKALEVAAELTMPNGKLPNIGDNDSGRLFKFANRLDLDPAWLLLWGRLEGLFTDSADTALRQSPESIWLFGFKEAPTVRITDIKKKTRSSKLLRKTGLALLRHDDLSLSVNVSSIGVNGVGGHKHNDQLAISVCWGADELILDPGMSCYTSDPLERDRLRSVQAHSTVTLNGEETNRFLPGFPFAVRRDGDVSVSAWMSTVELDLLKASHNCYSRMTGSPEISRTVYFDKLARFFLIRDEVTSQQITLNVEPQSLHSSLILSTSPMIEDEATARLSLDSDSDKSVAVRCYTAGVSLESEQFDWAPAYGVSRCGSKLIATAPMGTTEIIWGLFPNYHNERKENSEELIFEKMRLLHWSTAGLRRWNSVSDVVETNSREPAM